MKRVVLVYGNPDNGKTTLADRLRDEHGFHLISIDDLYVQFIHSVHPLVDMPALGGFIAQHYQTMFSRTGVENVRGWHAHIQHTILDATTQHDAVAAEGFLLFDCKDRIEVALKEQGIRTFQIKAEGLGYVMEAPRLTVRDVAGLGLV